MINAEYQKAHKHLALWISDKRRRSGQHPEEHGHAVPVYAHAKVRCGFANAVAWHDLGIRHS